MAIPFRTTTSVSMARESGLFQEVVSRLTAPTKMIAEGLLSDSEGSCRG